MRLCCHSFGAGRAGNAVRKTTPQVYQVRGIHSHHNRLMHTHVKRGSMVDARHVFDNMPKRDVLSWNIMILGHAKHEDGAQALDLYVQMLREGVHPSDRTYVATLKACSSLAALEEGKPTDGKFAKTACLEKGRAIHSHVVMSGFEVDVFVGNALLHMYGKCGSLEDTQSVFEELPRRDVVSWSAMIMAYANVEEGVKALDLYARMHEAGVQPSDRTFVGALKACSSLAASEERGCLELGRTMHTHVINYGFESDIFLGNILLDMYAKGGRLEDAVCVFETLPHRDIVSWNAMIMGYARKEEGLWALELYARVHEEGVQPNDRTFVSALKACCSLAALEEGQQIDGNFVKPGCLKKGRVIHFHVVNRGFESDMYVRNMLVDMYTKCRSLMDARSVFDGMPHNGVISWNSIILGYAEQEEYEEAFRLYAQMQVQGVSPDSLTFVAMLKACGNRAALETGKELHSIILHSTIHVKPGYDTKEIVATSLIDMYAKCGSMVDAQRLFDALPTQDIVQWSALIGGYARQGQSELVFHFFERLRQEGIQPDRVIFLSVLTVCSHVGLIDKGQKYLQAMSKQYGIIPTIDQYTCMVDLLGRAGQVHEAATMVEKMPFQPNAVVWLAVLGACKKWKNVEIGRYAFDNVVRLDENLFAAHDLMANIYANGHVLKDFNKVSPEGKDT